MLDPDDLYNTLSLILGSRLVEVNALSNRTDGVVTLRMSNGMVLDMRIVEFTLTRAIQETDNA